jgi:hypothetical protein
MKKSEIEEAARKVLEDHKDYFETYIHACTCAREESGWNWAEPDYTQPEKVVLWFHCFWERLPDNMSIHWGGFTAVCDIAENIFGFDDEDELALPS